MKIVLSPKAEKYLKRLTKIDQMAIAKKIRNIEKELSSTNFEKLQGYKDVFRLRVGNYQIVFRKFKETTYIILIGHRKDIYKLFKELMN